MSENERSRRTVPVRVVRSRGASPLAEKDSLAAEEPLEIRLDENRFVVTMRTPGDDEDLAVGLLLSEGIIDSIDDVVGVSRPEPSEAVPELRENVVTVRLGAAARAKECDARRSPVSSACGVCGKTSIDEVVRLAERARSSPRALVGMVRASVISSLPEALRAHQAVFAETGGLHAAGLFDASG
ncbi:MAG TPA: formate dehydrogenase accessory sulfurtransferase FdhD, partial [Thermoanaerobaculia bacterium]|nr:formate dehydrogenase accessory sulfurtransferase FdhD [Thermoanaerobaculia bacterium]